MWSGRKKVLVDAGAFLLFAGSAVFFLRRLLPVWSTHIPGGLEDTRLFLWNAWWFRYAIATLHTSPYFTRLLFYPFGCSLISHDYPVWNSLVTFTAQRGGSNIIAACNLSFVLTWALTGFCTFLLAQEITGFRGPALVAGLFVMTHSYTLARAMQNWGQFNVYGIPLFLWTLVRAHRRGGTFDYVLSGVALAWTAACHFYFLIYSGVLCAAVIAAGAWPWKYRLFKRGTGAFWHHPVFLILAAIAGSAGLWIVIGKPDDVRWGTLRIGLQTPANAFLVMWVCLFIWKCLDYRVQVETRRLNPGAVRQTLRKHAVLLGTALFLLSPLLGSAAQAAWRGDYPKQSILWKTHLAGANLFSLVMPNAMHALWGPAVSRWYVNNGMQPQEQAASLGWVCLGLVWLSKVWRSNSSARRWGAVAAASTLLAMGTYLHIGSWNLWLPMPFYFFRLLPILGNVRVPERWMAVGAVSWSVLFALALSRLSKDKGWRLNRLCLLAAALVLIENWPGIPVVPAPAAPSIYTRLAQEPPGGVLPLPFIIGDSSIAVGDGINGEFVYPWDHLWAQTVHHQPILGGYIGRIPRRFITEYKKNAFFAKLLALEDGDTTGSATEVKPELAREAAREYGLSYVLSYPGGTRPEATAFVQSMLPLEAVEKTPSIELYRVVVSSRER